MAKISDMRNLSKMKSQQAQQQEKAEYYEKYHKFKEQGKPFWPDLILEDTIAILIVIGVLAFLIFVEGVPLGSVADPSSSEFIPRPEWYFLFLFELLKYFPGALEWVGVVFVPSAIILLLLLIPFLDKQKRPARTGLNINMIFKAGALLSVFGVVFLTIKAFQTSPPVLDEKGGIVMTSQQQFGRNIYKAQGCPGCHALAGEGSGIPLDGIGSRMTAEQIHNYIENPQETNPGSGMPAFNKSVTHTEVEAIAQYLSLFKASTPVSTATPRPPSPSPIPSLIPAVPPPATSQGSVVTPSVTTAPASTAASLPVATTAPSAASGPPDQPVNHTGRTTCTLCHEQGIAGAPKFPANHAGRTDAVCAACHKAP